MNSKAKPPPLAVKCTDTDCDQGLHCFKQLKRMAPLERGKCRNCGADLIDWPRVHRRDILDAQHTFEMLRFELIRHAFFHQPLDETAVNHAKRKGRRGLRQAAHDRLRKYLAPAEPRRDGQQTPFAGNSIFYAQHATATCCRRCLEYWHDVPMGRELGEEEVEYCLQLVDLFLQFCLPDLEDEPVKVPYRRRARKKGVPPDSQVEKR